MVIDPRFNFRVFEKLLPESSQCEQRRRAKDRFAEALSRYSLRRRELELASMGHEVPVQCSNDSDDELFTIQRQTAEDEFIRWPKERSVGEDANILQYWQSKQFEYPVLSQMARDYLAFPATSAASERVFSNGSDIITNKRNRLAPDTPRYLLCLRSWGIMIEEEVEEEVDETPSIVC